MSSFEFSSSTSSSCYSSCCCCCYPYMLLLYYYYCYNYVYFLDPVAIVTFSILMLPWLLSTKVCWLDVAPESLADIIAEGLNFAAACMMCSSVSAQSSSSDTSSFWFIGLLLTGPLPTRPIVFGCATLYWPWSRSRKACEFCTDST